MGKDVAVHRVACLLTRPQYDLIKDAADKAGLSLSAYVRYAAIKWATK